LYVLVKNFVNYYLIPNAFWNIDDFDAKFERCRTINTITSEDGNLKNGHNLFLLSGKFCESFYILPYVHGINIKVNRKRLTIGITSEIRSYYYSLEEQEQLVFFSILHMLR
jgi:hypothetical protein